MSHFPPKIEKKVLWKISRPKRKLYFSWKRLVWPMVPVMVGWVVLIPLGRATPTTVVSLNIDWTWGEGSNMFLHVHNIRFSSYTMFVQRAQVKNLTICIIMYNVLYSTQHKFFLCTQTWQLLSCTWLNITVHFAVCTNCRLLFTCTQTIGNFLHMYESIHRTKLLAFFTYVHAP